MQKILKASNKRVQSQFEHQLKNEELYEKSIIKEKLIKEAKNYNRNT